MENYILVDKVLKLEEQVKSLTELCGELYLELIKSEVVNICIVKEIDKDLDRVYYDLYR